MREIPLKKQTVIGTEGVNLSGGEQQRIDIARAMLKDGAVAEQGAPGELYAQNGLYTHMVNLQTASRNWTLGGA